MFRECYFEYAGISSQSYNLILGYLSNSNEDFDSGGGFELKTDTLPSSTRHYSMVKTTQQTRWVLR